MERGNIIPPFLKGDKGGLKITTTLMVIEIGAVYMEEVTRTGFHPCICWESII
jgi:hypothetical protein